MGYKDPSAILDWAFLWADWLAATETISTATVTATTGITVVSSEINAAPLELNGETQRVGSVVTVWLSGGIVDTTYIGSCRIQTSAGRVDERSFSIVVRDR
jgi:hypothetical protein